jgi:hypothetical protein
MDVSARALRALNQIPPGVLLRVTTPHRPLSDGATRFYRNCDNFAGPCAADDETLYCLSIVRRLVAIRLKISVCT